MLDGLELGALLTLSSDERVRRLGRPNSFLVVERGESADQEATVELEHRGRGSDLVASPRALMFGLPGEASEVVQVGREPGSGITLGDPAVSSVHLRLRWQDGAVWVSDEDSQNGTTLNGVRLAPRVPTRLRDGDRLGIAARYRATFVTRDALLALVAATAPGTQLLPSDASRLLAGKVAVITGAGSGLGRAYALRFAAEGCAVIVNDLGAPPYGEGRDARVAAAVVAEIQASGGRAMASTHDISKPEEVDALFELAARETPGVDILVCSAGALHAGSSVVDLELEVWNNLLRVNAGGTFLCVQRAARAMLARGRGGRIITTSSMAAMNGNAGLSGYAASKAAVYALTLTAALELAPHGITVNALSPMAWTRLTRGIPAIAAISNVEQALSPDYVADLALFLASDAAANVTGQVVDVGGAQLSFYQMKRTEPSAPHAERFSVDELRRRWSELTGASSAD